MQCRSKNITCAFLVTAHIVHKAVVVSLRKIFWWNGFIIFITGKSSTKLHVTLFLDLSPSISFKLDPMDKANTYTRPSLYKWGEILHFFGAFFFHAKYQCQYIFMALVFFPYCLLYNSCEFCLENLYSINNYPPTDLSLYSHHLPAWYCFYIV